MWTELKNRYQQWDQQVSAALADPRTISADKPGYVLSFIAKLSTIERLQMQQFLQGFRGKKVVFTVLMMSLLFSLVALPLHWLKPAKSVLNLLIIVNFTGWMVSFALIGLWFNYRKIIERPFRILIGSSFAVMLGFVGANWLTSMKQGTSLIDNLTRDKTSLLIILAAMLTYSLILGAIAIWRNKGYETLLLQLELDAERERHERKLSDAKLQLLRAQIEPHFLFNTLGAVQQLAEQGAPQAARLTANLITFLRSSMHEIRNDKVSLATEFQLVQAYLDVMKIRMGSRLSFQFELPENCATVMIPGMSVLTLAENAIKHGLEPALHAGIIRLTAYLEADRVHIGVQDNGVGLAETPNTGVGLQNIRERLHLMYGSKASLAIWESEQGGVMAEIIVPAKAD